LHSLPLPTSQPTESNRIQPIAPNRIGPQVRVYQFSPDPQTRDVLFLESVGGRANNESSPVSEPPGFQLVLTCDVHISDVTALAHNPASRHVAAADRAGTVSLLDLSKPALLWLQAPVRVPVAALALSRCPLPPHRDRNDLLGSLGALPAGARVPCVLVVGADSTVGVLDRATGFFLSKLVAVAWSGDGGEGSVKGERLGLTCEVAQPTNQPTN
jgi:hypothetical protein